MMILQRDNIKVSFVNVFSVILTGRINPTNPIIKHMFAMLDPRRLPMEISMLPDKIAVVETIISGRVLVIERSMKPIVNSPNLVILAILTEDLTTTKLDSANTIIDPKNIIDSANKVMSSILN